MRSSPILGPGRSKREHTKLYTFSSSDYPISTGMAELTNKRGRSQALALEHSILGNTAAMAVAVILSCGRPGKLGDATLSCCINAI